MTTTLLVLAVVLVVATFGGWLTWTANRLDNLHHRVELAHEALLRRLSERAGWVLEVAMSGILDDAEAVLLADAAARARAAGDADRGPAESDLSRTLRGIFDDEAESARLRAVPLGEELVAASQRVELARRFHNDVVGSARHLRSRRRTRWFHLAGHAGPLDTVDLDDALPTGFRDA